MGIRFYTLGFALFFLLNGSLISKDNNAKKINVNAVNFNKVSQTNEDSPSPVMLSWIGTGKLGVFTISNTGQNGYFEPPVGWDQYTGVYPIGTPSGNGKTGEFPRGSKQYYIWSSGIWIGAKVRSIIGQDTVYTKRVATAAYYSDQGALSPLYQTNQVIPSGDGEGSFLFTQRGVPEVEDYQLIWTFADTSINTTRKSLGFGDLLIDPAKGDYLSDEDTYAVWGDYTPENEARTLFTDQYDTAPVGIRVEQRTYSWSTDAFIYLNYRITNMNDFALKDVYFGYFMDNDIGDASDDLIGYAEDLNLGYSYDSDLKETGWKTLAGYMGTVFLKTPPDSNGNELGLTGFQTWTIDGEESNVDNSGEDDLKYDQLAKGGFEIFSVPQDVRQLTASGPYVNMEPGETVEVTIAIVAGGSLDELRKNTEKAYGRYDLGYIGPAPPPSPNLTLEPGQDRVIVAWDNFPEDQRDPFSRKIDFEGYRLYRSDDNGLSWGEETTDLQRYPQGYIPIVEFDIAGNASGRFVSTSYFSGTSKAQIKFEGFTNNVDNFYNESEYSIEFHVGNNLVVYNLTQLKSYQYNKSAVNDGEGFAIIDRETNSTQNGPEYISNALISFDGIYISIKNDTSIVDGSEEISAPNIGDVFKIQTFESVQIGEQSGIDYVYIDENLTNGVSYSYSVTAFDAGDITIGLPSLESSLFANKQNVVPRGVSVDRTIENLGGITKVQGNGSGIVTVQKHHPLEMVTANFNIEFFNEGSIPSVAKYMRIVNTTDATTVVDSLLLQNGGAAYSFYGIDLIAAGPTKAILDTTTFGWKPGGSSSYSFKILGPIQEPYNYEIEFVNNLLDETYSGDSLLVLPGNIGAWRVRNVTLNTFPKSYAFPFLSGGKKFKDGSFLSVLKEIYSGNNDLAFGITLNAQDTTDVIQPGDTWVVNSINRPFLNGDTYSFSTQAFNDLKESYSLDEIKVVPNPFYVRAQWDTDRFNKHINFTHLPQKCRIRIFTTSGILINTIDHDENLGDPVGFHSWNLRNKENLDIASGLYVYQVKDLINGKEKLGKFAIIL